jgi:hypothetical protein
MNNSENSGWSCKVAIISALGMPGKIKLTVVSERGKEAVVGILEPSHFFGEGCLNGHPLRVTTATAIEQSLITDWHDPIARELFHEQVSQIGLYRIQRQTGNS